MEIDSSGCGCLLTDACIAGYPIRYYNDVAWVLMDPNSTNIPHTKNLEHYYYYQEDF